MSIVTNTPLSLAFIIPDITSVLTTFNKLRWFRSRDNTIFEAATAAALAPAVLTGTGTEPHALNGKSLVMRINGSTTVSVSFSGPDPYTTSSVIAAINGATGLVVASAAADTSLILTTVATGSAASIEIMTCTAATPLGFLVGDAALGLDADLTLAGGTYQYFYTDDNSSTDFFYKVQYVNSTTLDVSELSVPFTADIGQVVPYSSTAVGYVRMSDMSGRAIVGRKVTVANVFMPDSTAGYNIFRHFQEMQTDKNGYAEIRLIKGATIDVSVDGTNFTRRIVVPTTPDVFDLFDPALASEDEFGIQQPVINFAIRMS